MNLKSIFRTANLWFSTTPERALDQAYKAALMIKTIEDEHFNGKKISAESGDYGDSVISYFEGELNKYLMIAKIRLAEFKSTRAMLNRPEPKLTKTNGIDSIRNSVRYYQEEFNEQQSIILEKLSFIDEVIGKYSVKTNGMGTSLIPLEQNREEQIITSNGNQLVTNNSKVQPQSLQKDVISRKGVVKNLESVSDKTGVVPRSILRTVNRIQRELDPNAEEEVVKNFRNSKLKTVISIKFILTLIIAPILTHQVTKTFIVSPIVERVVSHSEIPIFLNIDMEEEAFSELKRFEEKLRFRNMIGLAPELSPDRMEEEVKEKASELAEEFRNQGSNAIKNIFADLLSLVAFCVVIVTNKQDIEILKSFIDDIVYGLSDSAKAFIIILFTDMFVGFHSPHGWEVILKGISQHLGIPENHDFIFLFIATFPVILDSVIKYWIFRYLNRISPSAVATYRNMNE